MPRLNDVALARRRQVQLAKLRSATGAALVRQWAALKSYDEAKQASWLRAAAPIVSAGQNRALDVQLAYLGLMLGEPVEFSRAELLALAEIDLNQPFVALARALQQGRGETEAVAAGLARARGLGESAVQWASRAANGALDGDRRIVGWRRTLTGKGCDWCRKVARQRYRTAESASFGHLRCDCGVDPIIGDRDPGRTINEALSA